MLESHRTKYGGSAGAISRDGWLLECVSAVPLIGAWRRITPTFAPVILAFGMSRSNSTSKLASGQWIGASGLTGSQYRQRCDAHGCGYGCVDHKLMARTGITQWKEWDAQEPYWFGQETRLTSKASQPCRGSVEPGLRRRVQRISWHAQASETAEFGSMDLED